MDARDLQISSAMQRFAILRRMSDSGPDGRPRLFRRALKELETALEELRVTQEHLVEGRHRLEEIQSELAAQAERYKQLFNEMPQGYARSRPDSTIIEANRAASELLNVSQRFLVGKTLSIFVCEARTTFLTNLDLITPGSPPLDMRFKLRPRERAPLDVGAHVSGDGGTLRWLLQTTTPSRLRRTEARSLERRRSRGVAAPEARVTPLPYSFK